MRNICRTRRCISSRALAGRLLPILGLLWICVGCQATTDTQTVKIGLVAPFEGAQRSLGYDVLAAVKIALAEQNAAGGVGGRPAELVALNDEGDPASASVQARKMTTDPAVLGVVGHWSRQTTAAALPVYAGAGLPLVIPVAGAYDALGATWQLGPTAATLAEAVVAHLETEYAGAVAHLDIDSPELEAALRMSLAGAGVGIAAAPSEAEVALLSAGYEETAHALRAYAGLPVILLNELHIPVLKALLSGAPRSEIYGWRARALQSDAEFRRAFESQTGREPGQQAGMAYRAAHCLLAAADQAAAQQGALVWSNTSACMAPEEIEFYRIQ
jgi:hypothetical protein